MTGTFESLEEGSEYLFNIHKRVSLPGNDEDVFILIGPDSKKYLLPGKYYENYDLRIGQNVVCKLDKINCSGQIFLEPEHPKYKIGEEYYFEVSRITSQVNALRKMIHTAWLKDDYNKEWPCFIDNSEDVTPGETRLLCEVRKIRKAELFLKCSSLKDSSTGFSRGEVLEFIIKDELYHDKQGYYLIADQHDNQHLLRKDDYSHFGFDKGNTIKATIDIQMPDGSWRIEPINPHYSIGEVYSFDFLRIEKKKSDFEGQGAVIWLMDHYGQENRVKAHDWQSDDPDYHPNKIRCKVVGFKKGRLKLENIEIKH